MRLTSVGSIVSATALALSLTTSPIQAQSPVESTQRYIVVLNGNVGNVPEVAREMANKHGFTAGHSYQQALKGFAMSATPERVALLSQDKRVAFISEDRQVSVTAPIAKNGNGRGGNKPTPTPAPAPAQSVPTGVNRINAELNANTGAGVTVAVLDTGIDTDHPDLQQNIATAQTCLSRGKPSAEDDNGHGTHVAGTIAAANNDIGVVGVASSAKIASVKVLDKSGNGYWSDIICGIDWVTANADNFAIDVVNMSLSGPGTSDNNCGLQNNDALHQAICSSVAQGLTYVVAAGNDGMPASQFVPASYDDAVITVSALVDTDGQAGGVGVGTSAGADDTFASFSNYGNIVDIGAPGVFINSTWLNGGYNSISGTSMASPHVAGAAALYLATNPDSSWRDVRNGLLSQSFTTGFTNSSYHYETILNAETL